MSWPGVEEQPVEMGHWECSSLPVTGLGDAETSPSLISERALHPPKTLRRALSSKSALTYRNAFSRALTCVHREQPGAYQGGEGLSWLGDQSNHPKKQR